MNRIEEIQTAIQALSKSDVSALRDWLDARAADPWDQQIEKDARSGKLDRLAEEALKNGNKGKCREL